MAAFSRFARATSCLTAVYSISANSTMKQLMANVSKDTVIKPDETVVTSRSDLYSGRDRAMELAISRLTNLRLHS